MKKIIISFLILLTLCSCKTERTLKPIIKNISFNAQGFWNGNDYEFETLTDKNFKTMVTVKSPEEIRNFKISFSGDFVIFYYLELEYKLQLSKLPSLSPLRILFEGLKESQKTDADIQYKDGMFYIKYNVDNDDYFIYFSETGLPNKITDRSGKNTLFLKNTTILN